MYEILYTAHNDSYVKNCHAKLVGQSVLRVTGNHTIAQHDNLSLMLRLLITLLVKSEVL